MIIKSNNARIEFLFGDAWVTVARESSCTLTISNSVLSARPIAGEYNQHTTGAKSWSASFAVKNASNADALLLFVMMTDGVATLRVVTDAHAAGSVSAGKMYCSGNVIIESFRLTSPVRGVQTVSVSCRGNGVLSIVSTPIDAHPFVIGTSKLSSADYLG